MAAIRQLVRLRDTGGKDSSETAYYLLSAPVTAERFSEIARARWGVENGLHRVLT